MHSLYSGPTGIASGNGMHRFPQHRSTLVADRATGQRPGLGFVLFLVGLNVYFVLPALFPADYYTVSVGGSLRYYVMAYLCMVLGGVIELGRLRTLHVTLPKHHLRWAFALAGVLVLMIWRSLIAQETVLYILLNSLTYFSLVFIGIIGQNSDHWSRLNKVFVIHTFAGGAYALWLLLTSGVQSRADIMAFSAYNVLLGNGNIIPPLCYAAPALVLSFPSQSKWGKLAAVLGYAVMLLIYVFWQSRIGIVMAVCELALSLILAWQNKHLTFRRLCIAGAVLAVGVLLFAEFYSSLDVGAGWKARLQAAGDLTQERWTSEDGGVVATVLADPRWEEAMFVAEQLTPDEWAIGRGVAATWSDSRVDPASYGGALRYSMVHVGYMHYIFQGGFLFLAVMFVPLLGALRAVRVRRTRFGPAAAGMVILYYIQMIGYGYPTMSLSWALLGLVTGLCFAETAPQTAVDENTPRRSLARTALP